MMMAPSSADRLPGTQRRREKFNDAYAPDVYRLLLRLTIGDARAAQTLTDETMERAWPAIDGKDLVPGAVRPWLRTLARRVVIDLRRSPKRQAGDDIPVDVGFIRSHDPDGQVLSAQELATALSRLSPADRRVLVELYVRGRTVAETAQLLDVPVGTVTSRAHQGLSTLREQLKTWRDRCRDHDR
jgi:RNA polymerase sigma-70 factor (ECF subfamily)